MSKMIKKSCPECFSQKQYCEECSFFNEKNKMQEKKLEKMLKEELKKHNDKMESAKQWLTPIEYHMLLRNLK